MLDAGRLLAALPLQSKMNARAEGIDEGVFELVEAILDQMG